MMLATFSLLELLVLVVVAALVVRWLARGRPGQVAVKCLVLLGVLLVLGAIWLFHVRSEQVRTVSLGQYGDSVSISPFGVQIQSRTGDTVNVGPTRVSMRVAGNGGQKIQAGPSGVTLEQDGSEADPEYSLARRAQAEAAQKQHALVQEQWALAQKQRALAEYQRVMAEHLRLSRDQQAEPSPSTPAVTDGEALQLPSPSAEAPAVQAEEPVAEPIQAEAPAQPAPPVAPQRLLSDHFNPDVYQSEGAALRGLTNQVASLLDSVTTGRQDPARIVLKGKISPPFIQEMMVILRKDFPAANVSWSKTSTRIDDETVLVYTCREPQGLDRASASGGAAADGQAPDAILTLRMDVTGRQGRLSRSVRFLDKPWVDDFGAFASGSRGRSWILALSRQPATGAGEAEEQAIADAIRQLEPRVRSRMSTAARAASSSRLQSQIRAGLESTGMIADRFVQRFERPYGDIWQVGLLVDASSKKIGAIASRCEKLVTAQQRTFRQAILSVAGVFTLVCVVYVVLNTLTRGYFVWSLRAAALAVIIGSVFLALLLSHNEPPIEGFLK